MRLHAHIEETCIHPTLSQTAFLEQNSKFLRKRYNLSQQIKCLVNFMSMKQNNELNREDKIMNTVINTSIILMSTLMEGFAEIVVEAAGAMASGMAEIAGGEKAKEEAEEKFKQKLPEVSEKMRSMISDMRKDLYEQIEQKRREIEPFLSNPIFDVGTETIEKYDFGVPKLTQELDDNTLAQYAYLLISEDSKFGELFSALGDWMNNLPKFPDKK
jgi:uncharacterized membrane protein